MISQRSASPVNRVLNVLKLDPEQTPNKRVKLLIILDGRAQLFHFAIRKPKSTTMISVTPKKFLSAENFFSSQFRLETVHHGTFIDVGYRWELLVVHKAQLRTQLKLARKKLGLLINFTCQRIITLVK